APALRSDRPTPPAPGPAQWSCPSDTSPPAPATLPAPPRTAAGTAQRDRAPSPRAAPPPRAGTPREAHPPPSALRRCVPSTTAPAPPPQHTALRSLRTALDHTARAPGTRPNSAARMAPPTALPRSRYRRSPPPEAQAATAPPPPPRAPDDAAAR